MSVRHAGSTQSGPRTKTTPMSKSWTPHILFGQSVLFLQRWCSTHTYIYMLQRSSKNSKMCGILLPPPTSNHATHSSCGVCYGWTVNNMQNRVLFAASCIYVIKLDGSNAIIRDTLAQADNGDDMIAEIKSTTKLEIAPEPSNESQHVLVGNRQKYTRKNVSPQY